MHTDKLLLHLSLIEGVGPATVKKIIGSSTELPNLYELGTTDFVARGISPTVAHKVVVGLANTARLAEELSLIKKHEIKWTTLLSADYPEQLKHIVQPPVILYWQGAAPISIERQIALVGARKGNAYAQRVIKELVPALVNEGWITVSGGARGVDSMVHTSTIEARGQTVAVLGSGLLRPYPLSNSRLFKEIVQQGGTLLSSFPLTMEAMPGNFPARNRIIAGLSRGCVVVQAAEKSGALITAHFALEQGREVFAIPGAFDDALSAGCHALIREGAVLVRGVADILSEFGQARVHEVQTSISQVRATGPEAVILNVCRIPVPIDEIAQVASLDLSQTQSLLFDLQLKGKVAQQFTGLWQAL